MCSSSESLEELEAAENSTVADLPKRNAAKLAFARFADECEMREKREELSRLLLAIITQAFKIVLGFTPHRLN